MTDNGLRAALADGIAYAMTRADLPAAQETAGEYAARLAPLVIESGYLPSLDDAWRKAEERLPHLGDRRKSWRLVLTSNGKGTYGAEALPPFMPYGDWMDAKVEAYEDSAAAALLALAERLAEHQEAPE